jgi:hypothetical protein
MEMINNDIAFTNNFINQLVKLIPKKVIEYWNPEYSNIGLVRFDNGKLDAIYIEAPSKYGEHNLIKFNVVKGFNIIKGKYEFDSVYSHYDINTSTEAHPWEYRYDKDLNVIAAYKFAESDDDEFISTQYKDGKKYKEYMYTQVPFNPPVFKSLEKMNILEFKDNVIDNINCLKVNGNTKIVYYWIR